MEGLTCTSEYEDAALVNELLSLKNVTRPAPPEPSVCVIPMYNFYKLDPAWFQSNPIAKDSCSGSSIKCAKHK